MTRFVRLDVSQKMIVICVNDAGPGYSGVRTLRFTTIMFSAPVAMMGRLARRSQPMASLSSGR
jgi:hypothetical protein